MARTNTYTWAAEIPEYYMAWTVLRLVYLEILPTHQGAAQVLNDFYTAE